MEGMLYFTIGIRYEQLSGHVLHILKVNNFIERFHWNSANNVVRSQNCVEESLIQVQCAGNPEVLINVVTLFWVSFYLYLVCLYNSLFKLQSGDNMDSHITKMK